MLSAFALQRHAAKVRVKPTGLLCVLVAAALLPHPSSALLSSRQMLDARIYQALEAARVQPPADTTPLLLECLARLHVVSE